MHKLLEEGTNYGYQQLRNVFAKVTLEKVNFSSVFDGICCAAAFFVNHFTFSPCLSNVEKNCVLLQKNCVLLSKNILIIIEKLILIITKKSFIQYQETFCRDPLLSNVVSV